LGEHVNIMSSIGLHRTHDADARVEPDAAQLRSEHAAFPGFSFPVLAD
jgi:hypothetical protein